MPPPYNITMPDFNWSNLTRELIPFSIQSYTNIVGFMFWPIVFVGIIGYIYTKQQSATAAVVAIILLLGAFGATSVLTGTDTFIALLQVFTAFTLTGLVLFFLSRRRR